MISSRKGGRACRNEQSSTQRRRGEPCLVLVPDQDLVDLGATEPEVERSG